MSSEPAVSVLPGAELVREPHRSVSAFSVWKLAGSSLKQKRDLMSGQSGWPRNLGSTLSLAVKSSVNKKGVLLGQPQKWRELAWPTLVLYA